MNPNLYTTDFSDLAEMLSLETSVMLHDNQSKLHDTQLKKSRPSIPECISQLHQERLQICREVTEFKNNAYKTLEKALKKVMLGFKQEAKEKFKLEQELGKARESQKNMKMEVVQLKEMINAAVQEYTKELGKRDTEIRHLQAEINEQRSKDHTEVDEDFDPLEFVSQGDNSVKELEIIHEESSSETQTQSNPNSNLQTIRDDLFSDISNIMPLSEENKQPSSRRAKVFIDNFRKNVEQKDCNVPKDYISKRQASYRESKRSVLYEQKPTGECTGLRETRDHPNTMSKSSSQTSILHFGDTDKINIPKVLQSPKSMMFVNKQSQKFFTQPAESKCQNKQNAASEKQGLHGIVFSRKRSSSSNSKNIENSNPKNSKQLESSNSRSSVHSSKSKEKIKVTAKIINELSHNPFQKKINKQQSIHLGGKSYIKKLLTNIKHSLTNFLVWVGHQDDELHYEGQTRKGIRWGKGKILYKNGMVYEGSFKDNLRHGIGKISLNGIEVYDGEWQMGQLTGQGYIKSLKLFSVYCPSNLAEGSYCGHLMGNKLHGMGTLFLNQKEKIVTKFDNNCPSGELTYYSAHSIEFEVWPSE